MKKISSLHWHKLDNSAKIFPLMLSKRNQNMFRCTWKLKENINPDNLLKALLDTLERFPTFKVKIKRGIFWFYLEENTKPLTIEKAVPGGIRQIKARDCNNYCFRISYFNNLIYADYYHVLCDGKSAIEFLKCLLYYYLNYEGKCVLPENLVVTKETPVDPDECVDGFIKNAPKIKIKDLKVKSLQGKPAFLLKGDLFQEGCGLINMFCDVDAALKAARDNKCSLTVFLSALFILSIYDAKIKGREIHDKNINNINLLLPINLRPIFKTNTLFNFSLFSRVSASVYEDMSLEKLIPIIRSSLDRDKDKTLLEGKIATTVMGEKFFLMRIMPLAIKSLIFKISNLFIGKSKKTATLSSLGIIQLPKSMEPYVERVTLNVCPTDKAPLSFTCVTFKDKLSISFARRLIDTEIEYAFTRYLQKYNIPFSVTSNFWEV